MNNWCVYIARDEDVFIVGVSNDLISKESLLNYECEWKTSFKIVWFLECKTKIEALSKSKELSLLDDQEKINLISNSQKIIILSDSYEIDIDKFPLVNNLRYTLSLVGFLNVLPELWKLNDLYMENVAEYLDIRSSQVINAKLWDIYIDSSRNVGLITKEKFFPIIKY